MANARIIYTDWADKKPKYGNRRVFDPRWGLFDSKLELGRRKALDLLERAGEIRFLGRQVTFQLQWDMQGKCIERYRVDFLYVDVHTGTGIVVAEDVKGAETAKWKKVQKLWPKAYPNMELRQWSRRRGIRRT